MCYQYGNLGDALSEYQNPPLTKEQIQWRADWLNRMNDSSDESLAKQPEQPLPKPPEDSE